VEGIVAAGIKRVHVATRDPNPESGSGDEALERAGIEVVMGPGQRAAAFLAAGFASRIERKRPRFSLKMAVSLDGRIASAGGDSRWISSETARAWAHRRRREADGIVIGAETATRDNPALSTRAVSGRNADRFVLDSRLRVSPGSRVWTKNRARRVAVTTPAAPAVNREGLETGGVEVWTLPDDADGRVDVTAFARRSGAVLRASLIDVIWLVTSRQMLLGGDGPGWTQGLSIAAVPRAVKLARADLRSLGPDWLTTVVPESAQWWDPETFHV
jgi:diaminohydroxyphosphoribosylaminopyrimidine deaminase/5-amino-6-(5-phosphoribosylamino)uracil reductase